MRTKDEEKFGMSEEQKVMYNMKLHETIEAKTGMVTYVITRVIGGWIYRGVTQGELVEGVFVPWNNEMQY